MSNYIIDNNSELSEVTDDLFKFLKVYDTIYAHEIEVICLDTVQDHCKMVVDKEFIEFANTEDSIIDFGKKLIDFLHCKKETADYIVEKAIISWKDRKQPLNIGVLKH